MGKKKIQVDKDGKEISQPLDGKFPITAELQELSDYLCGKCLRHWHPEMEFLIVTKGVLEEIVGGKAHQIKEGNGIFINSKVTHEIKMLNGENCSYCVIRFLPTSLGDAVTSGIYERYVKPLQFQNGLQCYGLEASNLRHQEMILLIENITNIYEKKEELYELKVLELMLHLWGELYSQLKSIKDSKVHMDKEACKIQSALDYIQMYYMYPISLENIAEICCLSKSSCCRIFKKVLKQTPIEYVTSYRINKSLGFIVDNKYSITEIALKTGFTNSSYFAEMFHKVTGMTPTQYKKWFQNNREK